MTEVNIIKIVFGVLITGDLDHMFACDGNNEVQYCKVFKILLIGFYMCTCVVVILVMKSVLSFIRIQVSVFSNTGSGKEI